MSAHRAYWGRTYGSDAQQRRREKERPYRYFKALQGLAIHHATMSEDGLWVAIERLLTRYLEAEPAGTLAVLEIDGPFTVEELMNASIMTFHLESLCQEGRLRRVKLGWYEAVKP